MRLLVITQKVDKADAGVLGFFHSWIEMFSKKVDFVTVICLSLGVNNLPSNTRVLSLGKEVGPSRLKYIKNFYNYIWSERNNYDAVFIHMNQEYVLLGGLLWKLLGKKVLLWRNHAVGNFLTNIAVFLSDKVFYTSPDSYTAKFKNSVIMPVGADLGKFKNTEGLKRRERSILSMGRISPVKHIDVLVDALLLLDQNNIDFVATIVGEASPGSEKYYEDLKKKSSVLVEKEKLLFEGFVSNDKTPVYYSSHEIFVNLTADGSMDKSIFSAMAAGAVVVVSNTYFRGVLARYQVFTQGDSKDLAAKLETVLSLPQGEKDRLSILMKNYVNDNHSLEATITKIIENA